MEVAYSLDEILPRCDVLNLLRIQFERQHTRPFPSVREYALLFAMNRERMARAKSDILIMAPGPINRGVEVTPDVADGPHSVILDQVNERPGGADGRAVAVSRGARLRHQDERRPTSRSAGPRSSITCGCAACPNLFTAVADVTMGYLFVQPQLEPPAVFGCLLAGLLSRCTWPAWC